MKKYINNIVCPIRHQCVQLASKHSCRSFFYWLNIKNNVLRVYSKVGKNFQCQFIFFQSILALKLVIDSVPCIHSTIGVTYIRVFVFEKYWNFLIHSGIPQEVTLVSDCTAPSSTHVFKLAAVKHANITRSLKINRGEWQLWKAHDC